MVKNGVWEDNFPHPLLEGDDFKIMEPVRFYLDDKKPDVDKIIEAFQNISNLYGTPFSSSAFDELYKESIESKDALNKKILEQLSSMIGKKIDYIDYRGRTIHGNHVCRRVCEALNIDDERYITGRGQYSFKKSDMEYLVEKYKNQLKNNKNSKIEGYIDLLNNIIEYNDINRLISTSGQLLAARNKYEEKVLRLANEEMKDKGKEFTTFNEVKKFLRDPDLFYVNPTFKKLETCRISTSDPNIQGFRSELKELITAPEGYKIATMDIKGQEVHILIWGILENKKIKENYIKYQEPYRAIIESAGYEFNEHVKADTKTAILGIMNGMSMNYLLSQINNRDLGIKIYKMITEDPGYINKVVTYAKENKMKPNPMRRGLFGTEMPIEKKGRYKSSLENQLKNGFFQLTAGEIASKSIQAFILEVNHNKNVTEQDIRLLLSIYDEFVMIYREDLEEYALNIFESCFKPVVEDWPRFRGEVNCGKHYLTK